VSPTRHEDVTFDEEKETHLSAGATIGIATGALAVVTIMTVLVLQRQQQLELRSYFSQRKSASMADVLQDVPLSPTITSSPIHTPMSAL
jgi:hypothetical protein